MTLHREKHSWIHTHPFFHIICNYRSLNDKYHRFMSALCFSKPKVDQ